MDIHILCYGFQVLRPVSKEIDDLCRLVKCCFLISTEQITSKYDFIFWEGHLKPSLVQQASISM